MSFSLSRDQILALEAGEELDQLVATRVMGWTRGIGNWLDAKGHCVAYVHYEGEDPSQGFSPSRDISAAWEVVEKIQAQNPARRFVANDFSILKPRDLQIGNYRGIEIQSMTTGEWFVAFDWDGGVSAEGQGFGRGATLPLAICLAALLAVMEGE